MVSIPTEEYEKILEQNRAMKIQQTENQMQIKELLEVTQEKNIELEKERNK